MSDDRLTACITSHDGMDMCVCANTKVLYERLGILPALCTRLVPADVLVLLRGGGSFDVDCAEYQSVHVYNYVGQDRSGITLRNVRHLVVIEHQDSLAHLRPKADRAPDHVVSARHAVYPEMWRRPPRRYTIDSCHIGNYKPITRDGALDPPQRNLISHVNSHSVPVWGRGWDDLLDARCLKGSVSLWRVPEIYAHASATLGLRYPYQREHDLISSRYWLAPLAGCPVISDEPPLRDPVPGVFFDTFDNARVRRMSQSARADLATESARYWSDRTQCLESRLSSAMTGLSPLVGRSMSFDRARATYLFSVLTRKLKSAIETFRGN